MASFCHDCDPLPAEGWEMPANDQPGEKMVMSISRKFNTTTSVMNAQMKQIKKVQNETICVYRSKDGTQATTDTEPTIVVKRECCEQVIIRNNVAVETVVNHHETFTVIPPLDSLIQSRTHDPIGPSDETLDLEIRESLLEVGSPWGQVVAELESKIEPEFETIKTVRCLTEIEKFVK